MALLDFREIPAAKAGNPNFDAFELFCRDVLAALGFDIVTPPSRGPDGGRDILCEERRIGPAGSTVVRWLVSCKHLALSGRSVGIDDEPSVSDRLRAAHCTAFMGFYSTLPSTALLTRLQSLGEPFESKTYDHESLEQLLLSRPDMKLLSERYFPESYSTWRREHPSPADIRVEQTPVLCASCQKDLLSPPSGIVLFFRRDIEGVEHIVSVQTVCKGQCDFRLEARLKLQYGPDVYTGWEDILDLCIPTVYLSRLLGGYSNLATGTRFSATALEEYKQFLIPVFSHVSRELTSQEQSRLDALMRIPSFIGGLG